MCYASTSQYFKSFRIDSILHSIFFFVISYSLKEIRLSVEVHVFVLMQFVDHLDYLLTPSHDVGMGIRLIRVPLLLHLLSCRHYYFYYFYYFFFMFLRSVALLSSIFTTSVPGFISISFHAGNNNIGLVIRCAIVVGNSPCNTFG